MPTVILRKPRSWQKPYRGALLNRGHSLSRGLVGCWVFNELGSPGVWDAMQRQYKGITGYSAGKAWWNADNLELDNASTRDAYIEYTTGFHGDPSYFNSGVTVISSAAPTTGVTHQSLIGFDNPYMTFCMPYSGSDFLWYGSGSNYRYWSSPADIAYDTYQVHALTCPDGKATNMEYYINGTAQSKGSGTSSTTDTPSMTVIGASGGSSFRWQGGIKWLYIYDRVLSLEEIKLLGREPYCIFQKMRVLEVAAGPAGVAPTGAIYGPLFGPLGGPV